MNRLVTIILYVILLAPFKSVGQQNILKVEYDSLTELHLDLKNKIEIQQNRMDSIKQIIDTNSVQALKEKIQELTIKKVEMDSLEALLKSNTIDTIQLGDLNDKANKLQEDYKKKEQQLVSSTKEIERFDKLLKDKQLDKENLTKKITERISRDKDNVNNINSTIVAKIISNEYEKINEDIDAFTRISNNPYYRKEKTFSKVNDIVKAYQKIHEIKLDLTIPVQPNRSYSIDKAIVETPHIEESIKSYYNELIPLLQNYCKVTSEVIRAVDEHLLFGNKYDYSLNPKYRYLYKELYDSKGTLKKFNNIEELPINTNFECGNE